MIWYEEEKIINGIRNLFRLEILFYTVIKDKRNISLNAKKKRKQLKIEYSKILTILLSHEEENYYKPVSNSHFEYESKDDTIKALLVEE